MAAFSFGLVGLTLNIEEAPIDRRVWMAGGLGAIGGLLVLVAILAPGHWAASIAELFGQATPIESLLSHDRKKYRESRTSIIIENVVVAVLIIAINTAFWLLEVGEKVWFFGVLIPALIWGGSRIYRKKFENSQIAEVELEAALRSLGYVEQDKSNATKFLKLTFLRDDVALELKSLWIFRREGSVLFWGRFTTGGERLNSGLFCGVQFSSPPDPTALSELLGANSTTYFDEKSQTVFGTLDFGDSNQLRDIDGLQWQLVHVTLIGRIDNDLLKAKCRLNSFQPTSGAERLVAGWSALADLLCRRLLFD
jgi:hypothetical protein